MRESRLRDIRGDRIARFPGPMTPEPLPDDRHADGSRAERSTWGLNGDAARADRCGCLTPPTSPTPLRAVRIPRTVGGMRSG